MAARQTDFFTVSRPDDLDELERRLADDGLDELTIAVPEGATTLFTAREFRRLAAAARQTGVILRIATDDPLRRELARIIGLPVVGPPVRSPATEPAVATDDVLRPSGSDPVVHEDAPTRRIDVPAGDDEETTTVEVPYAPWRELDTASGFEDDEVDDGSYSFVITPPARPARDRTEDLDASWAAWSSRSFDANAPSPAPSRRRARHGPRVLAAAVALLIVVVVLLVVAAPSATIAVSPRVETVETRITYGIAAPGQSFDFAIPAQTITTTITTSASIPTTGERFVPDGAATGSLLLTNPSTAEVFVAAGAIATASNGVEFVTTTDVVVPAADPYGSMTFGSVAAPVRAAAPGTDGNAEAETIYGQWDNGVFFTNREPITGGTMRRVATVSDADRAALEATARGDLDARAAPALSGLVPSGATVLPGTEQRGEATLRFDHAAGDDATTLRVEASLPLSAQIFDPQALRDRAIEEVTRRLAGSTGDGQVVAGSVAVSEPQPLGATAAAGYEVRARAEIERPIDPQALDALRDGASGANVADIVSEAISVAGVASAAVDRRYSWLWGDMPLLTSRITIEVNRAETTLPAEATPAGP